MSLRETHLGDLSIPIFVYLLSDLEAQNSPKKAAQVVYVITATDT